MATVSSHILDSVAGTHAAGIRVECYHLSGLGEKAQVFAAIANEEGRISQPVEIGVMQQDAQYELIFHSADYFTAQAAASGQKQIMEVVVIRLAMPDPQARYHIPLVLSPHSYTVWWSG